MCGGVKKAKTQSVRFLLPWSKGKMLRITFGPGSDVGTSRRPKEEERLEKRMGGLQSMTCGPENRMSLFRGGANKCEMRKSDKKLALQTTKK